MEAASSAEALQELQQHLCTETEPSKLYQTLQKLSSLPKLRDTLAEMNFQHTMELLRKEQLLVPFAKDLAAIWSERSQYGPHPEPDRGDFAFALSLITLRPRNCPEDKPRESAPREHRRDGTEVFQSLSLSLSPSPSPSPSPRLGESLSPHSSLQERVTSSPRPEPRGSKRPRVSLGDPELAAQNQVPVAKPQGSTEEPWRLPAAKAISSESGARRKIPGHWMEEGPPADPLEACLNSDSSPPSSALQLQLQLTGCKRRGKSTRKAEALSSGAKVPRGKSDICQDQNGHGVDGCPLAEHALSLQAGIPPSGQEQTSIDTEAEDPPWTCRKNFKTPVYSGPTRDRILQKSQKGCLPKPLDSRLPKGCQGTAEQTEPWQLKASPKTHIGKPTHSQTERATIFQLQEPPELRLQALRARLQDAQAKKPGGRQTKMVAFQVQAPSPGQQAESGARGAASSQMSRHQEASAQGPPRRAPCLLPLPPTSNKPQPKKRPAPLMTKALRDYKKKLSRG
nr:elongin-A3 member D-like [Peromyscus maniculatus bairdii]